MGEYLQHILEWASAWTAFVSALVPLEWRSRFQVRCLESSERLLKSLCLLLARVEQVRGCLWFIVPFLVRIIELELDF